ncbi:sialic acid-binding Ig-like lectin 10 isoform X2 [Sciurus carolinensis]|uniref:sialic acid-binding Ig-like lectin 10 isoform X2 n=1 Tax=Sciurus carolinensis TaxID=30640 RepID=UPI001FB55D59|nr:sialic acid-binding Ig-like lectin 10 isoform X2 [Sciurus carolinensis]
MSHLRQVPGPPKAKMLLLLSLPSLLLGGSQAQQKYWLRVPESVTVQRGLCALVSCSFSYPRDSRWTASFSVHGYWFREGANTDRQDPVATSKPGQRVQSRTRDRFQLVGDPSKDDCSLMITDARWEDEAGYFFRVERGPSVKYNFLKGFSLKVTGLTQKPDVFLPATLEPGRPVPVLCVFDLAFERCPAPSFSWSTTAFYSQGKGPPASHFSTLSLTPELHDHGTALTCQVVFPRQGVSTQRTVQLSVAHAPKEPVIQVFRDQASVPESQGNVSYLEVQKGQFLRLLCAADSHPPATLSWVLEDRVLSWSCSSGPRTLELELPTVRPGDSGRYTCRAENGLGSQRGTLDLSVQYPPEDLRVTVSQENRTVLEVIRNGTSLPVLEGQSLRLVCVAHSHPPARLSWTWGPQTLSPEWPSDPGVLELPWVQTEHEGEFTCHARSPLGAQHISLSLSVHYPPRLLGPSCSWEARALRCSCSSRAWPAPSLHWRLGEGLLEGNSSNASLRVTSSSAGPWANSSLSLHEGVSSGLRLSCEAQNAHGTQSATLLLLPDETPGPTAFSRGVFLGIGVTAVLSLCLVLVIVKTLRKARPRAEAGPRVSRSSTILEYINLGPKAGPRARDRKVMPSNSSRIPSPDAYSPGPKKDQKELHSVPPGYPEPRWSTPALDPKNSPEELHYAALTFPGLRQWATQVPKDTHTDYEEIKFH